MEDEDDILQLKNWVAADFVTCGGHLMWFAGAISQAARLHKLQVKAYEQNKQFPVPGGRFYIMPADVKYGYTVGAIISATKAIEEMDDAQRVAHAIAVNGQTQLEGKRWLTHINHNAVYFTRPKRSVRGDRSPGTLRAGRGRRAHVGQCL